MPKTLNALELLRRDHKHVLTLLKRISRSDGEETQRELCEQIVSGLQAHTEMEERVFYPYLLDATGREDLFQEASIEHETVTNLLDKLPQERPGSPRFMAMMKVLNEYVALHVEEEEMRIFPQVEKSGVDLVALGQALEDCRNGHLDPAEPAEPPEPEASAPAEAALRVAPSTGGTDTRDDTQDDEQFLHDHAGKLSRSTRNAHWIHHPGEQPGRHGQTLATRSLEVIRQWAEARGARPATIPGGDTGRPRTLRFDFPGFDKQLQEVSWDAWGGVFEERDLVFVYQETTKDGRQSNFFVLDSPEREDG